MTQDELALADWLADCTHDPLKFVLEAFPWGEKGTELEKHEGPDEWQRQHLEEIGKRLRTNPHMPIQEAISSGHGIGKSADASWIILWALSTFEMTRGVVTANTENQLRTKTWAELAKWHRLFIGRHLFRFTATAIYSADPALEKEWRIDAIPWSERNTEAFAGLHNEGKRLLCLYDEASAIPDVIWEVTEGALTDAGTEILWLVRGNPTRNTGRFHKCFGANKHRWITRQVDSRTVKVTNKAQIQQWVDDYGEDSDFVRVRVRGVFPRAGSMQLIPTDVVAEARKRDCEALITEPVIIGVDVARFGDDQSVIAIRQGRDAKSRPWRRFRGIDTMTLASEVHAVAWQYRADAIFVDGGGMGAGVVDRLEQLNLPPGCQLYEVNFGGKAMTGGVGRNDAVRCANKGAQMWVDMGQWCTRGALPDEQEVEDEMCAREYGYNAHGEIMLERKEDMKKRGLSSPDNADALCVTFALPVAPKAMLAQQQEISAMRSDSSRNETTGY